MECTTSCARRSGEKTLERIGLEKASELQVDRRFCVCYIAGPVVPAVMIFASVFASHCGVPCVVLNATCLDDFQISDECGFSSTRLETRTKESAACASMMPSDKR